MSPARTPKSAAVGGHITGYAYFHGEVGDSGIFLEVFSAVFAAEAVFFAAETVDGYFDSCLQVFNVYLYSANRAS